MTISIDQLRRCSVAFDLGTARARVYVRHVGVIVDEPSVAAVDSRSGRLIAVGVPAERMEGRTPPNIEVVRPVCSGTIVDVDMAQRLLKALVGEKRWRSWRRRPSLRVAVCVPHDADRLTHRAAVETFSGLGARRVELVDTLVSAAVAAGLPVQQPRAAMIAVCGATTSHIAVLSLGSVVAAQRVPVGGDSIDRAVVRELRKQCGLRLRSQLVRPLRMVPSERADGLPAEETELVGRDMSTGRARRVRVGPEVIQEALQPSLAMLLDAIREVLHDCPPDLVADLVDSGMALAGGSALLPGLDSMISKMTGMAVHIAEKPGLCPVNGLGALLEGRVQPVQLDPLGS